MPLAEQYHNHISAEDATYVQHTTAFSMYLDLMMQSQHCDAFARFVKDYITIILPHLHPNNYRHPFFQTNCKKIMVKPRMRNNLTIFLAISWLFAHFLSKFRPKLNFVFPSKMLNLAILSAFHPKRFCSIPSNIKLNSTLVKLEICDTIYCMCMTHYNCFPFLLEYLQLQVVPGSPQEAGHSPDAHFVVTDSIKALKRMHSTTKKQTGTNFARE